MNTRAILVVGILMLVFLVKGIICENSKSCVRRHNSTEYIFIAVLFALIILIL